MSRRGLLGIVLVLTSVAHAPGSGVVGPARGAVAGPGGPVVAKEKPAIEWREWSREAFDEATAKRKLVLLDITATWCHWCRVMAEESYTDSAVVSAIGADFIPIRVDYDLRPDIGDRYLANGWPTTAVLSASGHLLLAKTYLPPVPLRDFLKEAVHFYRANRRQVDRKVAQAEMAVARTWEPDSLLPPTLSEEEYVERTIEALRGSEDKEHGGFGVSPKTARWDAISFLLRAADARRDDGLRALAVRAAAAALALQDSVDGGFFRLALEPDWTKMRYERLLDEQAAALSVLTRVYRATGEERFKKAAERVEEFVSRTLSTGRPGDLPDASGLAWHHAVTPDVRRKDGSWMDGEVFFRLSAPARRRTGSPTVSRMSTTDASARMWSALFAHYRAARRPGPGSTRRRIRTVPGEIRGMMEGPGGGLEHARRGDRRSGFGLLSDQAAAGHALLDAYESSRKEEVFLRADTLAAWMRANLEDPVGGGFRYAPRDTTAIGRLKAGDKPEGANAEAGLFFLRRYWLNGRSEDREVAERTARYLQSGEKIVLDPARAELVLRLREEPTRLLVIGEPPRPRPREEGPTEQLWEAALAAPVPEVAVRFLAPPTKEGGPIAWPDGPPANAVSPAIYRWTATGWRGPVTDPDKLGEILDKPAVGP